MDLHNLNRSQKFIDILNSFRHCINYSRRCERERETSQAEKATNF